MLISDQGTMLEFMPFNADMDYDLFERYLFDADENRILHSVYGIGRSFYNYVVTEINPSPELNLVRKYLRSASANWAYMKFAPFGAVDHANAGITVTKGEHVAPVSDAKLSTLIAEAEKTANAYYEKALEYMETDDSEDFDLWRSSNYYTARRNILVASVVEFQEQVDINNSRILFMQLRPYIKEAETFYLKGELGPVLYAELKAYYQAGVATMPAAFLELLERVQVMLARFAYASYIAPTDKERAYFHKEKALIAQSAMVDYLKQNKGLFPNFPQSETRPVLSTNNDRTRPSQFLMP